MIPENLSAIRKALSDFDADIRSISTCPICGLPQSGVIPVAITATKGKATNNIYHPGQHLHPADAGLCNGHSTPNWQILTVDYCRFDNMEQWTVGFEANDVQFIYQDRGNGEYLYRLQQGKELFLIAAAQQVYTTLTALLGCHPDDFSAAYRLHYCQSKEQAEAETITDDTLEERVFGRAPDIVNWW